MLYRFISFISVVLIFSGCSTKTIDYGSYSGGYEDSSIRSSYDRSNIRSGANIHRATMRPYTINGKKYYPTMVNVGDTFDGIASWYGPDFHGKKTSNGETYNMYDLTAAHKTLPMNTVLRVTNLKNKKSAVLRVNDRGPFVKTRIIDLSYAAAKRLGVVKHGTAPVHLEVVGFDGKITTLTGAQTAGKAESFMLQIGAFRNYRGAVKTRDKNHKNSHSYSAIVKKYIYKGEPLYRVYLKGFRSKEEIEDFKNMSGYRDALIVGEVQ